MGSLERLARTKFTDPPLSEAEERVVRAASDGNVADCHDLGGGDDPAEPENWPTSRNVRGDLIRWLSISREAREQVDPKGVWILGARITGQVDLSFTIVPFSLFLFRCRVEQTLILQGTKMPMLNLAGSWTGAIAADGLKLEGSLYLRDGFHAQGEVRLLGAIIGGDLNAEGGTFENPNGKALSADGAKIGGNLFIRRKLSPEGKVENEFMAEGEVRLVGATIGSYLEADGGTFRNPSGDALNADGVTVMGGVFLRNGFHAEGEVRLLGATIGGNLEAIGGTFKNLRPDKSTRDAMSADGIKVHGGVLLCKKFVAEGTVRLHSAEVNGPLEVTDAWLDALNLHSARVSRGFYWRNIHKGLHPDFPNKEWKRSLDLTNAKVGLLADEEASWPEKGQLCLDGFVYDRIAAGPKDVKAPIDAKARLRWLGLRGEEDGYSPQPYEQLIAVLRQMGHEHQVAEIAIAKQKDLCEHGSLSWWGKFWSRFRYLVIGYGYKPWWAFGWMAALLFAGTLMFSVARYPSVRVMVPSDKEAYQSDENSQKVPLPSYYPQFHGFVYSLDVILPFDLGQKAHWRLHERWPHDYLYWLFEGYALIQLFLGWVLLLVAAAVPAGFIKKD